MKKQLRSMAEKIGYNYTIKDSLLTLDPYVPMPALVKNGDCRGSMLPFMYRKEKR